MTDNFVFVTNATTAVIRVVKHPKLGPEDMILCTSHTYNACYKALDSAVRRAKADIITINISVPYQGEQKIVETYRRYVGRRSKAPLSTSFYHVKSLQN